MMRTRRMRTLIALLVLGECSYGEDGGDNTGRGYGAAGATSALIP